MKRDGESKVEGGLEVAMGQKDGSGCGQGVMKTAWEYRKMSGNVWKCPKMSIDWGECLKYAWRISKNANKVEIKAEMPTARIRLLKAQKNGKRQGCRQRGGTELKNRLAIEYGKKAVSW